MRDGNMRQASVKSGVAFIVRQRYGCSLGKKSLLPGLHTVNPQYNATKSSMASVRLSLTICLGAMILRNLSNVQHYQKQIQWEKSEVGKLNVKIKNKQHG
jgi:hypothetical protein